MRTKELNADRLRVLERVKRHLLTEYPLEFQEGSFLGVSGAPVEQFGIVTPGMLGCILTGISIDPSTGVSMDTAVQWLNWNIAGLSPQEVSRRYVPIVMETENYLSRLKRVPQE